MNILIVDDERPALLQLEEVLKTVAPNAALYKAERVEKALELFQKHDFDVVFLDITMPGKNGLSLAKELKMIRPMINLVMVTAYPQYALEAYDLYVSDYILKPVLKEDVQDALNNLRNPVREETKGLYVQCFGSFEVFCDGRPVHFKRSKTKELFAYLIDRRGASATNAQLRAVLWKDGVNDEQKQRQYFSQITRDLRLTLEELGCRDLMVQQRDFYAILPEKIKCDYYLALQKDSRALSEFQGEYMSQYDWAEERVGSLISKLIEKN